MIFISAGHTAEGIRKDPGAVGSNGLTEASVTREFRNLVTAELDKRKVPYIKDVDSERLGEYLARINTGNASVVLEFHCDASENKLAVGTTALIEADADRLDRAFAKELSDACSLILGVKNRGVKSEAESHRGSLGLMKESGILCLLELFFISNLEDQAKYQANKSRLAVAIADIIIRYENLI